MGELSGRAAAGRVLRVLVVEDHVDTLALMERLLQRWGHISLAAKTCDEAMAVVAGRQDCGAGYGGDAIDLVLGDIGLPDCDGVELMRDLKVRLGCPVWVVSGYGQAKDVERSRAAGLDGHLIKPIDAGRLRAMVDLVAGVGADN